MVVVRAEAEAEASRLSPEGTQTAHMVWMEAVDVATVERSTDGS